MLPWPAKNSTLPQLFKHFEHNSDIVAMRDNFPDDVISVHLPDFKQNYRFLIEDDFEAHYKAYYEYEKERGVEYGPESLDGNGRFECIADIVEKSGAESVLDYGCAHGHYTINIAKRMPDIEFDGVDLAKSNIDIAAQWEIAEKLENTSFWCGDHTTIEDEYDLIIAAEVLEHIEKPGEVVDTMLEHLNPGGTMLVSVPYGPWEAQGYELHPGWRAHIHHLERADLKEMFGHFDDYKCLALPHQGDVGHYVLTFTKPEDGRKCGQIDYARKFEQQAPRQTLSVCMLARDEEDNIGRCIKSIGKYADEVIIGIDNETTDATYNVIESLSDKHPTITFKVFYLDSPTKIGFDAARNETIGHSTCDWILWIDADETIENVNLLPYYLRQNPYDGYLVQQHHYAAEPPAILQTDLPCRLFRNHQDIKFFGMVHEHPSVAIDMNAGPGRTYTLPNIHIMHTGYATETKRRKRFARNFPLLEQDREKHPDRTLGKFLYVRDLAHMIRYERENNAGAITREAYNAALKGVELWNDLLSNGEQHTRYLIDSLPYYSDCVGVVTNGDGIQFTGEVNKTQVQGYFADKKAIETLMAKLTESAVKVYGEKYF